MIKLLKWYRRLWDYSKTYCNREYYQKAIKYGVAFYFTTLVALIAALITGSNFVTKYLPFITNISNLSYWALIFLSPLIILFIGILILILLTLLSISIVYFLYLIFFPWIICSGCKKRFEEVNPNPQLKNQETSNSISVELESQSTTESKTQKNEN